MLETWWLGVSLGQASVGDVAPGTPVDVRARDRMKANTTNIIHVTGIVLMI